LPYYDDLTDVDKFLDEFEREVPEKHCFQDLHLAISATPARWWGTHKDNFNGWHEYIKMMRVQFARAKVLLIEKYDGRSDPPNHLAKWTDVVGHGIPQGNFWGLKPRF